MTTVVSTCLWFSGAGGNYPDTKGILSEGRTDQKVIERVLLGFFGVTAQMFLTSSFKAADASVVLPFDYTRLPFIALVGWVAFEETVGIITWAGASVIVGSALYVVYRERQLARPPTKPEPPH